MIPGLFVLGLLVGSAVGGTAALLVAPERGSEPRRRPGARVRPVAARVSPAAWDPFVRIRGPPTKGSTEGKD
jgi:gas vesicle protein